MKLITKADGFEMRYLQNLISTCDDIKPKLNEVDAVKNVKLVGALMQLKEWCSVNKCGQKKAMITDKKELEELMKLPENVNQCLICAMREVDSMMLPCKHKLCRQCYELCMLQKYYYHQKYMPILFCSG